MDGKSPVCRFVEFSLSFVITHCISFFTNWPVSTPELNGILTGSIPAWAEPGPGITWAGRQEGLHSREEAGDGWLERALLSAREVGLFSLNWRE